MAMVQGTPGYLDFPSAIERSVWKEVAIVKPSNQPLYTVVSSKMKARTITQSKYEMQHDFELPLRITLASGDKYAGGSPTTTYTSAPNISMFQVGAIWRNYNAYQSLKVTSVVGNVATLATLDGSNVTAANTGDLFEYQYFPHEQGGTIKTPISSIITYPFNGAQIFATPFGVDDTTEKTLLYNGQQFAYEQRLNILRHKAEMEYAMIYGAYSETTGDTGRRLYTTAGLTNISVTYQSTYPSNALTFDLFMSNATNNVFATGTEKKYSFANNASLQQVTQIAEGNIRIDAGHIPEYGLDIMRWDHPMGQIAFVRTSSIRDPKGMFIFCELDSLGAAYMQKTYLKPNIQLPNQMQRQAAYITEVGTWQAPEEYLNVYRGV